MENVSLVDGHIDNGLSDEDIIRRLKGEIRIAKTLDRECCYNVKVDLIKDTLSLINRLKAEIESLKHRKTELQIRNQELQHEKSEAIKEFAERLKAKVPRIRFMDKVFSYADTEDIDNLVKEMVGDAE